MRSPAPVDDRPAGTGPVRGLAYSALPAAVWWGGLAWSFTAGWLDIVGWALVLGWVVAGGILVLEVGLVTFVQRRHVESSSNEREDGHSLELAG